MVNHSKITRKDNPATKPRNPQPKSTNQAQNNEPYAEEGNTHHPGPTSDNGPPTTSTEPPRRTRGTRGRPKRTVQQFGSMGQEPAQTEVVVPRKRGRKAATLADDDHGSQPPLKKTKNLKGKAKMKLLEPHLILKTRCTYLPRPTSRSSRTQCSSCWEAAKKAHHRGGCG
jgi:hypothetical protein